MGKKPMGNKSLVSVFPHAKAYFENPISVLEKAVSRYGEIKTFFSKYTNPIGIELEIEGVTSEIRNLIRGHSLYWRYEDDGSLKVAGAEFVSHPLSGKNIDYAIHEFSQMTQGQEFLYSVRCSTHVHLNLSFLDIEEFKNLILVAAMFEPLMHQLCTTERKNNPYCYPITQLDPKDAFSVNPELKYCGINPAPARTQLTLEFRQLHGTNDWRLLRRWVQLICKMYYYVKSTPSIGVKKELKHAAMGTVDGLAKKIFGASMILFHDVDQSCRESATWVLAALPFVDTITFGD